MCSWSGTRAYQTEVRPKILACLFPICFTQSKAGADGSQSFSTEHLSAITTLTQELKAGLKLCSFPPLTHLQ